VHFWKSGISNQTTEKDVSSYLVVISLIKGVIFFRISWFRLWLFGLLFVVNKSEVITNWKTKSEIQHSKNSNCLVAGFCWERPHHSLLPYRLHFHKKEIVYQRFISLLGMNTLKGLENKPGQHNCFLNVVIQSLWHLPTIRQILLEIPHHCHKENCILCAIKVRCAFSFWRELFSNPTFAICLFVCW
jgi:hypothetical protein